MFADGDGEAGGVEDAAVGAAPCDVLRDVLPVIHGVFELGDVFSAPCEGDGLEFVGGFEAGPAWRHDGFFGGVDAENTALARGGDAADDAVAGDGDVVDGQFATSIFEFAGCPGVELGHGLVANLVFDDGVAFEAAEVVAFGEDDCFGDADDVAGLAVEEGLRDIAVFVFFEDDVNEPVEGVVRVDGEAPCAEFAVTDDDAGDVGKCGADDVDVALAVAFVVEVEFKPDGGVGEAEVGVVCGVGVSGGGFGAVDGPCV